MWYPFFGVLAKNKNLSKEIADKPKLRASVQNNWSIVIQSFKVMEEEERLGEFSILKKTKEAKQASVPCGHGPGQDGSGTISTLQQC
jgi:hypothetical protein